MRAGSFSSPGRPEWRSWLATLPHRVRTLWRAKGLVALLATLGFCIPYFLIGSYPLFTVRELPLSAVDRLAGFHPELWVWVYQSIYLPINVIPWLTVQREHLGRYARGFALVCSISFAIFLFFPIRGPRPEAAAADGMYWLLRQYDVPLNSIPSLHAGLLVLTLCYGRRMLGHDLPRGLGLLSILWAGLILYSTIATKQHYALDIVAGALLGWGADAWIWRDRRRQVTAMPILALGDAQPALLPSRPPAES